VDHAAALTAALDLVEEGALEKPDAVGHRVVHGGPDLDAPTRIDSRTRARLEWAIPFAPIHLPIELRVIDAVSARHPEMPQVACFDTAFHATLPEVARRLPLPRELFDVGIRRYGFHGLSYEYVVETIGAAQLGRAVIAHLGNGASMAAVRDGKSIDTTMGLTPTGGLVMGTRTGDLDPGVLLYLMRSRGDDGAKLDALVNHESGLLGISGTTPDMKALLAARSTDPRAALAVDMFCAVARKTIGAFATVLGGLDSLVFTGGIGEHAPEIRAGICRGLEHLGVHLDPARNAAGGGAIEGEGAACAVRVVATDEEKMIARHVERAIRATGRGAA
jgi:acetate kinase